MVTPHTKCRLRLLKQERIKDYLLMEEEFIRNQERLKPQEEKNEEERSKVDDLRGTPMSVGSLEEIIDDNHAIVPLLSAPSTTSPSCLLSTKTNLNLAVQSYSIIKFMPSLVFFPMTRI